MLPPPTIDSGESFIVESLARAGFSRTFRADIFRGGIYENCRMARMGKGHKNDGEPFDLNTACYLKPVLAEIERESTRIVILKAAVKTLKTFVVEMSAAWHVCHRVGDANLYFGTGDIANDQAKTRFLDWIGDVTAFREKLRTIDSRFDNTTTLITFPDKSLRLLPANLSSTQGFNLCFVGICDAFLTEKTGMIKQAIARTKDWPDEKKIIIESQGGETDFDFDAEYENTNQAELHVRCPVCGQPHIFNWRAFDLMRPDNFVASAPLTIPSLDRQAWIEHWTPILKSDARRRCGFQRGADELIKISNEEYDAAAVLRETYFECFHCGGAWRDDGEFGRTRIALDKSSHYVPARQNSPPGLKGFNLARWINRRERWGEIMLEKLSAQKTLKRTGNVNPLKQWWQKIAGRTWDNSLVFSHEIRITPGSYDPQQLMPDEDRRRMSVDCQQNQDVMDKTGNSVTGWFWYIVRIYDKFGNSRQLARGFAKSWEEWIAVQKYWGVPNDGVIIDIGHWRTAIMERAAMEAEIVKYDRPMPAFIGQERHITWRLAYADAFKRWPTHRDGKIRAWFPEQRTPVRYRDQHGNQQLVMVKIVRWEKSAFRQQLDALRSGSPGMPKMESLAREMLKRPEKKTDGDGFILSPDALTLEMETENFTYEAQMNSEQFVPETNRWHVTHPQDHYRACEAQLLVLADMEGKLGGLIE